MAEWGNAPAYSGGSSGGSVKSVGGGAAASTSRPQQQRQRTYINESHNRRMRAANIDADAYRGGALPAPAIPTVNIPGGMDLSTSSIPTKFSDLMVVGDDGNLKSLSPYDDRIMPKQWFDPAWKGKDPNGDFMRAEIERLNSGTSFTDTSNKYGNGYAEWALNQRNEMMSALKQKYIENKMNPPQRKYQTLDELRKRKELMEETQDNPFAEESNALELKGVLDGVV